ncbi:MAG: hypothetical protein GXO83_01585 [Chlorobi bacterium]|nr:hypothetical protein [Chlorobiota bacterium]
MKILKVVHTASFLLITPVIFGQRVVIPWPQVTDSSDLVDTHSRPIEYQEKKTWSFPEPGVYISNEFTGARVNEVTELNDSTFSLTIRPENFPINMSPWYAFKIWSRSPGDIYIKLRYEHGRHRYYPKTSKNGKNWTPVRQTDYFSTSKDTTAFFRLHTGTDTLWVSAQELMTSEWLAKWVRMLAEKPWIRDTVFGYSTLGKPLRAMKIGSENAPNMLIILSRQHPPEITGFKEMNAFVETLNGDSRLARKFRKNFYVVVAPMMNPDGVDNGHWRHNAGGIDLNRDWRWFNQPETFAFRAFVLGEREKHHSTVRYGIDFHSTQVDLFYMPADKDLPSGKGITRPWITKINKKFPDHPFSPEPSGLTGQISKNWILHELHAEAITYEVGDNTDREVIRKRGETSAKLLMKILLKEKY